MKFLQLAASLAAVTLLSSLAIAGPKWVPFFKGNNFEEYLLQAPVHADGHFVKFWQLYDYSSDQKDLSSDAKGQPYRSSIDLVQYNCAEGEVAVLQFSMYKGQMGTGDQVSNLTAPDPAHLAYIYIIPGTLGERNMRLACSAAGIRRGN